MGDGSNENPLYKYKLVFLGDQGVGKTSIITRFMYDCFDPHYQATIGIDFLSKTIHLDNRIVRLQLWDTAGQERFRSLIPSYIRDSAAAVVVYDITNTASFLSTSSWIDSIRAERGTDVVIALVGNKCDEDKNRQVSKEDGLSQANQYNVLFMETSAKLGNQVEDLFMKMATELPQVEEQERQNASLAVDIELAESTTHSEAKKSICFC